MEENYYNMYYMTGEIKRILPKDGGNHAIAVYDTIETSSGQTGAPL